MVRIIHIPRLQEMMPKLIQKVRRLICSLVNAGALVEEFIDQSLENKVGTDRLRLRLSEKPCSSLGNGHGENHPDEQAADDVLEGFT